MIHETHFSAHSTITTLFSSSPTITTSSFATFSIPIPINIIFFARHNSNYFLINPNNPRFTITHWFQPNLPIYKILIWSPASHNQFKAIKPSQNYIKSIKTQQFIHPLKSAVKPLNRTWTMSRCRAETHRRQAIQPKTSPVTHHWWAAWR